MDYIIYYLNQGEDRLPIRSTLKECGIDARSLRRINDASKNQEGYLAIVHHSGFRKAVIEEGKDKVVPLWVIKNGIVIFASSDGGVRHIPSTSVSSKGYRCHIFGINAQPVVSASKVQFLSVDQWSEIINWAKSNSGKESIEELHLAANEIVKKLLWPDEDNLPAKRSLAVLLQGYLFCFIQVHPEKVTDEMVKHIGNASLERANVDHAFNFKIIWETVQQADWWLRIYIDGYKGKTLSVSERAKAVKIIKSLLPKVTEGSNDTRKLIEMLESGTVHDASVVAMVSARLRKELA